ADLGLAGGRGAPRVIAVSADGGAGRGLEAGGEGDVRVADAVAVAVSEPDERIVGVLVFVADDAVAVMVGGAAELLRAGSDLSGGVVAVLLVRAVAAARAGERASSAWRPGAEA